MFSELDRTGGQEPDFLIELPVYAIELGRKEVMLTCEYGLPVWTDEDVIRAFLIRSGLGLMSYTEIETAGTFLELLKTAKAAGIESVVIEGGEGVDRESAIAVCMDFLIELVSQHACDGLPGWQ